MHVVKVETNLKAGCNVAIGPKTLIVGPNRSGKSTIVNAIEAALSGRVSDVAGRKTLAKESELWTLAAPGAENAFAIVKLDNGETAEWWLAKGKKAVRKGTSVETDGSLDRFPLRAVYENLTGSPETARKWLLGHLVSVPWSAVLDRVSAAQHDRLNTLTGKNVAALPSALDTAKAGAREATRRAEMLREQARSAAAAIPVEIEQADSADRLAEMERALAEAHTRLKAAQEKVATLAAAVEKLPALNQSSADVAEALLTVLTAQVKNNATKCVLCSRENPLTAYTDRHAAVKKKAQDLLQNANARAITQQQHAEATDALHRAQSEITIRTSTLAAAKSAVDAVPTDSSADNAKRLDADATKAETEAAAWAKLADEIAFVISNLVEQGRAAFEARVQKFLPDGFTFGLDLLDDGKEVCRFGLRGESGLRSALSGVEWATVTTAVAEAVSAGAGAIIIPEDRSFDPVTLTAVLTAFGRCSAQVIVATTTEPVAIPEGWVVVRTGLAGGTVALGTGAPPATPPTPPKRRAGPGRPRKVDAVKLNAEIEAAKADAAHVAGPGADEPGDLGIDPHVADDFDASIFEN